MGFAGGAYERGDGNAELPYHMAIIAAQNQVITPSFLLNEPEYS